jgi:glycosyltransferase involved in cell wall biosynthesis
VVAIVAAYNSADRISATVSALADSGVLDEIVVVD